MNSEPKSYSEIVEACMTLDPKILDDFKKLLQSEGDEEWLIVSDYHMEKSDSYENFVSVFTVLPASAHYISHEDVNKGLPTKLSQSHVTDCDIAFLKGLNHFTFVIASDKKIQTNGKYFS